MTVKPFVVKSSAGIGTSVVPNGTKLAVVGGSFTLDAVSQEIAASTKFSMNGGNLQISGTNGSQYYGVLFPDGTFQNTAATSTLPGGTNRAIQFNNSGTFGGNVNQFILDNNGNVGIGTSTPTATLHVVGTANIAANTVSTSTTTGSLVVSGGIGVTGNAYVGNVNVGNHIDFTKIPYTNAPDYLEGRLWYSSDEDTLILYGNSANIQIPIGEREWVRCRNSSGAMIPKGTPVYEYGVHMPGHPVHGHHPLIAPADASDVTKRNVIGVTGEDIQNGAHGYVIVRGYIETMNTSALTSGQRAYLGAETPGTLVATSPDYPNYPVSLGFCLTSNATVGTFYVSMLDESFDKIRVIGSGYTDGNFTVGGNLTVNGTSTSLVVNTVSVGGPYVTLLSGDSVTATFFGTGTNDLIFKGKYTGTTNRTYYVKIDSVGATDTFAWSYNNFSTTEATNVAITGSQQLLSYGVSVEFVTTTGHTLNDAWQGNATITTSDFGMIGNYVDNQFEYAGLIRDSSDGNFKFFRSYTGNITANINTSDSSFALGNIVVEKTISNTLTIAGPTDSTSTATGAIIVTGGVGISGNLNIGGNYTGTWNGTTIGVAKGGTGLTSGTSGGVLYYSATGTLASSGALAANSLVVGGGAGSAPSTITTGTGVVTALGVNTGSAGAFVVNGGALGTPSSGTLTNCTFPTLNQNTTGYAAGIAGGALGQLHYQTGVNTTGFVGVGTSGYVLTGAGSALPQWTQATSSNTASTIVQRDASGNFSAGTITATLSGSATSAGTATTATTATNIAGGTNGQIPYNTAAGTTSFIGVGTSGYVLTGTGAGLPQWTQATNTNTASTIVQRDASGNFSAGTITATLSGNASSATTATTATTATNIASGTTGQIPYQSSAGTTAFVGVGTASYALVGNGAAAPSWLQYTNTNTASTLVQRDASGNFSAGTITATLSGSATSATTATNIAGGSTGQIHYQSGAGTTAFVGVGTSGYVLTGAGAALPQWTQATSSNTASTIVQRDASGNFSAGTITAATGLTVSAGGASITGNLSVTGNLLISGNVNVVNSNVLVVDDPIIYIGDNNPADAWDMGLVASYTSSGYKHTGFARDNSNNTWTIFDNLVTEPSETINWSQAGLTNGNFKAGNISVASGLASTTSTTGALIVTGGAGISGDMNVGGNITGTWNGTTISVAKGGTGLTSGTSGGVLYYSATGTLASSGALAANALVVGGGAGAAPSTITTGTGVVTALGVNTGSVGGFVVNGGALGTPSSGTLTNCTFPTLNQNTTGYAAGIAGGSTGQIVYQTAANTSGFVGVGTSGWVLTGAGSALPQWTQATNSNTASTIVQRDASGNFSAGTITATLSGNASSATTATTATTATNIASGTTGQIPYQSGAGTTAFVGVGTSGYVLTGAGAALPQWTQATNANTASTIVQRDGSGNFSAGTITASLTGTASIATNVAGGTAGQLHYQSGVGTTAFVGVGTASYALVGNGAAAPSWLQYTNANTASTIVQRDASGNFSAGTITATLSGNASSATTATTATTATNIAGGTNGQIPYNTGSGATSFVGVGTSGYVLTGAGAALPQWTQATNANTASTIVQRDASGNFSAGTITASLTGTASTATNLAGGTAGALAYQSGVGATSFISAGASGTVLTGTGGTPAYSASPTLTTSLTVPIVYGGTTASSSLTLQSTSGAGTSDNISFKVGNAGATTAMTITTSGNVGIGTTAPTFILQTSGDTSFNGVAVGRGSEANSIRIGNGINTGGGAVNYIIGDTLNGGNGSNTYNIGIGRSIFYGGFRGSYNIGIGHEAFQNAGNYNNSIAIGYQVFYGGGGNNCTAVGYQSQRQNNGNANNSSFGYLAHYNGFGTNNSSFGYQALYSASGSNNTAMGPSAGANITIGSNNTVLGGYTGLTAPISQTGNNWVVLSDGAGTVRQVINSNGNVGIGTATPTNTLHVQGSAVITGDATIQGTLYETSDIALKDNVETITGAIDIVNQLRGVNFDWKASGNKSSGIIAQELEQVLPYLVRADETGYKTVNYTAIIGVLIEAIKELSDKVEKQ